MNLTDDQKKAVQAIGSVAVTAGAGTGKTAMLAARYLHHVIEHGLSPIEVVAVTFTEKAAAELRSRIRAEMRKTGDETRTAEVDAAQISTVHALAARICRDFYDIAGIPADFTVMDETDSRIRHAEWFAEALTGVDADIIRSLGYSWLSGAITELLRDPISSAEALEKGSSEWRAAIETAKANALENLRKSVAWIDAAVTLERFSGEPDDKLEAVRINVITAMNDILAGHNIAESFDAFDGFRSNGGAVKNWPNGGIEEVRACLASLRNEFRTCQPTASLEFGDADMELAARVELLKKAFYQVREHIAGLKRREKLLDYGDLEYYALKILKNAEAREHYAKRWRAMLIDEFQDTNPVQEQLLNLLKGDARLTVVGDEKQSIYGFRRADTAVFARFREEIGIEVKLSMSFRTHHELVSQMNAVFAPVLGNLHQSLEAARAEAPYDGPHTIAASILGERNDSTNYLRLAEGRYIAGEIRRMLDEGRTIFDKSLGRNRPIRPGDIAILSRTRAPLDVYIEELLDAGIPAVNTGGGNLLETREAKDAMALLTFAADTDEDIALVTLLRSPFFAISDRVLYQFARKKEKDQTWWNLIQSTTGELGRAREILQELLEAAKINTAERLVEIADEKTGYTAVTANLPQGARRMADWLGFLALLRRFAALGRPDVFGAARYLRRLVSDEATIPRPPIDAGDAVSLMTIHGSKGLEWPVVFVPDLARKKPPNYDKVQIDCNLGVAFKVEMPNIDAPGTTKKVEPSISRLIKQRSDDSNTEEAKRVLYVAITRARDRIILTAAGEKGPDLELLRPGIEAAGIEIRQIPAGSVAKIWGMQRMPESGLPKNRTPLEVQVEPVKRCPVSIPVTALTQYAVCPRRFEYRYVKGHPGIEESNDDGYDPGGATKRGRVIGTLAHTALELGLTTPDELRPFANATPNEMLEEAIALANTFNASKEFAAFRGDGLNREVPLSFERGGITFGGQADLVGEDFVLDYKTDSEVEPHEHRFQLWAYAEALGKPNAHIAYLRASRLHSFSAAELNKAGEDALKMIEGIAAGKYAATPSDRACSRCDYRSICEYRIKI